MRTRLATLLVPVCWFCVTGCAGSGSGTPFYTGETGSPQTIDKADADDSNGRQEPVSKDPVQAGEGGGVESPDAEVAADAGDSVEPGEELGKPCSENQDCESGLCVKDYDGSVCTDFCVDQCPQGWACKDVGGTGPDVIYACVPTAGDLCKPCDQNTDCGGSSDVCVRPSAEAAVGYCGASCSNEQDCPAGFACAEGEGMDGAAATQCVPAEGDCTCPPGALPGTPGCEIALGDMDEDGIPDEADNCPTHDNPGQENFDGDALGDACDPDDDNDGDPDGEDCAPLDAQIYTGAEEVCDGVDNSCNNKVDDGFPDSDGDGTADCVDSDDDNDGALDREDCDPLNPQVFPGTAELCDGIDNNCDNQVDEGFEDGDGDGIPDCLDQDSDNDGDPDAADCAPANPSIHHGAEEVCDGVDNDCDTLVDESFADFDDDGLADCVDPDDDNDGDPDSEDCAPFNEAVFHGATDLCDGLDNDCDDGIDEDYGAWGQPCDGADSDQCVHGTWTCAPDGLALECANETLIDLEELCNGEDEDCDGEIDEDFPELNEACDGNDADSCAFGTYACALNGQGVVCQEIGSNVEEVCNGADDDCDGLVDEGFASIPDLCNGKDDNCDGVVDEAFPQVGKACDGPDADSCALGTYTCAPNGLGVECGNEIPVASSEVCNGLDDDCDGQTDEDFSGLGQACDGNDSDLCANGELVCNGAGNGVVCGNEVPFGIAELCNGQDDDCDGQVDENFVLLGQPCDGPDSDECPNGTYSCAPGGTGIVCANEVVAGIAELCNGQDDDCDGQVDEDFATLGLPCDGSDPDQCENGTFVCAPSGSGVVCANETSGGSPEACNGIDDDCDGQTDEDFATLGQPCDGLDSDFCANGTVVCNVAGTGVQCGNEPPGGLQEICNGLDDDCDGETDENNPTLGDACDGNDLDQCLNGVVSCNPNGIGVYCAETSPAGVSELCNGEDDDCDGQVDENFGNLGQTCDGNDADLCGTGTWTCAPDGLGTECVNETNPGIVEICNGQDEDCDGQVDEDFAQLGESCDGDDSDSCFNGTLVCAPDGAGVVCQEPNGGILESCNGLDDDCDGEIDEENACTTVDGVTVQPYTGTGEATQWYAYGNPIGSSTNADVAISNNAIVYFYKDPAGNLSLVVTLDQPNDGSGGSAQIAISGAYGMTVLVSDDPGEATLDPLTGNGLGNFNWLTCCTDGFAIGYWTQPACVTLTVNSGSGINNWVILSQDGSQQVIPGGFVGSTLEVCGQP